LFIGNSLQAVPASTPFTPNNNQMDLPDSPNTEVYWSAFLNAYGSVKNGISQIWLKNEHMDNEIVGTISLNPNDDRLLIFDVDPDTLPQNTLDSVDSVVNPFRKAPGEGLDVASQGHRYLIVENLGSGSSAWGQIYKIIDGQKTEVSQANANDIIMFDGTDWVVDFDSENSQLIQFVTNLTTGVQYRYLGGAWMKSYEGWYGAGDFSIVI
jgi:hypothetical protein